MKDLVLKMDDYLPLRDVVFNTLREAILIGDLKPGERLMEVELSNHLGVSRTPVREALRMLELEGLVEMIPRRGARVASITKKDLQDVLEVRASLEILAAQLASERADVEDLTKIKLSLQRFEMALAGRSPAEMAQADEDFHDQIILATNNARLLQILNNLRQQIYRYRLEYLKDISDYEQLLADHRELVKAIEDRDAKKAGQIMGTHIYNQESSMVQIIEDQTQER